MPGDNNNNLYSPVISTTGLQHEIYISYAKNSRRCFDTIYNMSDLKFSAGNIKFT